MNHYSLKEWSNFLNGTIDATERTSMEDHLLECDTCSEIYLSLFEDETIIENSMNLSSDFTENIMCVIHESNAKLRKIKNKNALNNMLIYYAAAACLTLFLTSQGVFNYFFEITKSPVSNSKNIAFIQSGWTDRLADYTSSILDNLVK